MRILFPCSPLDRSQVDPDFKSELEGATAAGHTHCFYSHECVEAGEFKSAVREVPPDEQLLLRGWMITGEQYSALYEVLRTRGSSLLTSPTAYSEAHYLPLAYAHMSELTPRSGWIVGDDPSAAWDLYQGFRAGDAMIKDWVKSAKHRWIEACFLPAHSTQERFFEVFSNFRTARGHLFNRGVVIRRYASLATRGTDIRGFPLVDEYRLFYFNKALIAHPGISGSNSPLQEIEKWNALAGKFESRFISIDVALLDNGGWTVIEVGDGGVSGLPLSIDPAQFYASLPN